MRNIARSGLIVTWVLAIAACGGGGGGGGTKNSAPTIGSTAFSGTEDTDLSVQLSASDPDGDALTFTKMSDPANGTVDGFTPAGAFVYHPKPNFNGNDSFALQVSDSAGNTSTATVTIAIAAVNDPPVAANDVMRADGTALTTLNVLANDSDVDGDALTVTIEEPPLVGTATVNADKTIRIDGLPAGFRGLTRLRYRITDPAGEFRIATLATFVGTDPFRVAFAGEPNADAPEVYFTDFVSTPWRVSLATERDLTLRGFVASDNGSTVVYRRANAQGTDLSFVRTSTHDATADEQVRIALPTGFSIVQDASGSDQYAVSPDGQWIAIVASRTGPDHFAVFVLNVSDAATLHDVATADTAYAAWPRFSRDSQQLYFLAGANAAGTQKSLFRATPTTTPAGGALPISAPYNGNPGDIAEYSVSPDQARVVIQATRGGRLGLYLIDPAVPTTETQLSHTLAGDEILVSSTVGLPAGRGGSTNLQRVAYTVLKALQTSSVYVAEVSASPNARLVTSGGARAVSLRADDAALLFSRFVGPGAGGEQIFELLIDAGTAESPVGAGSNAIYDSTGDLVMLRQSVPPGGRPVLAAAVRPFGNAMQMGTSSLALRFADMSGADRSVALLAEGPVSGSAPATAHLELVNARAPDKVLNIADFESPLDLATPVSRIITY